MDDHQLSSVLQLINAVRNLCDLPLLSEIPKGVSPDDPEAEIGRLCPLARAIPEIWVAETFIHTQSEVVGRIVSGVFKKDLETSSEYPGEFLIDLPDLLIAFVARHDNHELLQFIEES